MTPLLLGFTAAVAQIVLLRELLAAAGGNEISIGLALAGWLAWTAAGSALAGRAGAVARHPRIFTAALQAAVAVAAPAAVLAARAAPRWLGALPGESLGPGAMLAASLAVLAPVAALSGALFAAASRLPSPATGLPRVTGRVYLFEAVGSAVGGLAAALVLLTFTSALEIAAGLGALNLAAAAVTSRRRVLLPVAVAAACVLVVGAARMERVSIERFWRGFRVLAARDSAYGSLAVLENEGVRSLYSNGAPLFHSPDPEAAEESVHYALLEHPAPASVLLIGGGPGSVAEALRHPGIRRVDLVEPDPAVLDFARRYFPSVIDGPRAQAHPVDGRRYLKAPGPAFDAIILALPGPATAQLNRFYTVEFFREAARRLTPGGVLSFRIAASETYLAPETAALLRSLHVTLRAVFPEVAVIPGASVHFFAAMRAGVLARGSDELLARLRQRKLAATYVREYYLPFRMLPDRVRDLESAIAYAPGTPVNHDFAPIAYYLNGAVWSSQFGRRYGAALDWLARAGFVPVAACAVLVLALLMLVLPRSEPAAAATATAAMGLVAIGLEILLLLAFQAVYGYVYRELALLIAAFMAGMAIGGGAALRRIGRRASPAALAAVLALAAAAPLLLAALFPVAPPWLFPALAFGCGFLGGYEFPLASGVFFADGAGGVGTLYALDLAGSALGALLFSVWLIPVFGFFKTAVLMTAAAAAGALMVWRARLGGARRTQTP